MRVLSNYQGRYTRSTITEGLFDLLLTEILSSDVNSELMLVSPWMRNIEFPTSSRGELKQILNYKPTKLSLETLLNEYFERGGKASLICLPPHRLINQDDLDSIIDLIEIREMVEGPEILKKLNDQITHHTSKILGNRSMLEFLARIKKTYDKQVEIYYNSKLHAKIFLGQYLGILGSANMTHYGFKRSDEVCLFFNDEYLIKKLKAFTRALISRDHSERLDEYNFSKYIITPNEIVKMHPDIEHMFKTVNDYLSTKKIPDYYIEDDFEYRI